MLNPQVLQAVSGGASDVAAAVVASEVKLYCKLALATFILYHTR